MTKSNIITKSEIADWFLENSKACDVTPKKMQKLMYYAYAWGLVFFNDSPDKLENKLFDGKFEAWVHGPVDRQIYAWFADFGYNPIPIPPEKPPVQIKNPDVLDLLQQINDIYGDFSGNQLERLTHQEKPWLKARGDAKPLDPSENVISDKDMYIFYGSKLESNVE